MQGAPGKHYMFTGQAGDAGCAWHWEHADDAARYARDHRLVEPYAYPGIPQNPKTAQHARPFMDAHY